MKPSALFAIDLQTGSVQPSGHEQGTVPKWLELKEKGLAGT